MKHFKKLIGVVAVISMLTLSACGSNANSSSANSSSATSSSKNGNSKSPTQTSNGSESKTITIALQSGPESDNIKQLAPEYEKQNNVKIKFSTFSYSTLFTKELQSVTSKTGTYDMIFMDDPWMSTFAGGGYLTPLSKFNYTPKGFVKGALQVDQWPPPAGYAVPKGTITKKGYYGLPVTGNVTVFAYRKDLAKKYGINPKQWTWADVIKLGEKAKADNVAGFVMRSGSGNSAVTDMFTLAYGNGGSYFDKNWNSTVDSKAFVNTISTWVKLFNMGPKGEASFGSDDVGTYMQKGQAASAIIWPSGWANKLPSNVGIAEVPGVKQTDGTIKVAPEIGVWSAGIPTNSQNQQGAFDFMKWVTSKKQQEQYASSGLDVPTMKSVILDPALLQKYPWFQTVYQSLNDGIMRPRTPAWPKVEELMGNELVKAEQGQETPAQAAKNAKQAIDSYMKQSGQK